MFAVLHNLIYFLHYLAHKPITGVSTGSIQWVMYIVHVAKNIQGIINAKENGF